MLLGIGILAFGGLWFWVTSAVFIIAMLAFIEYEKPITATLTVAAMIALLTMFSDINPISWVAANWKLALEYIGIYLVVGVVWAVVKWGFFLMNQRDYYEKLRADFFASENDEAERRNQVNSRMKAGVLEEVALAPTTTITDENRKRFQDHIKSRTAYSANKKFPPQPNDHKARILLWMGYWPFSATWTLINDPLKRFWRFAYQRIIGLLGKMSEAVFSKYKSDLG